MGYRINFSEPKTRKEYYGRKLYGYTKHESLPSFLYLVKLGKLDPETVYFDYPFENRIVLTAEQFREFIKLYETDSKNHSPYPFDGFKKEPDYETLEEMVASQNEKEIFWD